MSEYALYWVGHGPSDIKNKTKKERVKFIHKNIICGTTECRVNILSSHIQFSLQNTSHSFRLH